MRSKILGLLLTLSICGPVLVPALLAQPPAAANPRFADSSPGSKDARRLFAAGASRIGGSKVGSSIDDNRMTMAKAALRPGSKAVISSETETPADRRGIIRAAAGPVTPRYQWAIKTNVAYLAATVANLGVEFGFGERYSVDFPIIYSPYTVARDYRLRFLAIQPEFRYWLKTPMKGHFFGAHIHIGAFNISVDGRNRYQSPDGFYGVGLSYGYMLSFARRWAAEFTIGAGYVRTKYDTYYNIPDGARCERGTPYNYWGLTKVGIGLAYKFGK